MDYGFTAHVSKREVVDGFSREVLSRWHKQSRALVDHHTIYIVASSTTTLTREQKLLSRERATRARLLQRPMRLAKVTQVIARLTSSTIDHADLEADGC